MKGRRIRGLRGFGAKKEEAIGRGIRRYRERSNRMTRPQADAVLGSIAALFPDGQYAVAGSYRRGASTVGKIDIVTTTDRASLMDHLSAAADADDGGGLTLHRRCPGERQVHRPGPVRHRTPLRHRFRGVFSQARRCGARTGVPAGARRPRRLCERPPAGIRERRGGLRVPRHGNRPTGVARGPGRGRTRPQPRPPRPRRTSRPAGRPPCAHDRKRWPPVA
ncbi:protein of unknown function [Methanoculleus bourgensis]|uniref:DNA polymerase beta palm domain-containing protein n=1 Tax=Methanoculleus bourgensis TaxID=83986 RepID=A0A0X3BIN2_9EURY|nr:protein of unknown function [Methanoculleus bourgensis]